MLIRGAARRLLACSPRAPKPPDGYIKPKLFSFPETECVSDTTTYTGTGKLANKVAVVTGGGRGIGKTICEVFAKEGATVHFCGLEEQEGEDVKQTINRRGGQATFTQLDVTDHGALANWVNHCGNKQNKIDIVVPNAVMFKFGSIDETNAELWDELLSTNVKAVGLTVKYCLPWIRMTEQGGSIVVIGSISGFVAQPKFVPYNTTKAAVMNMSRCLAMDLGPENIRVNVVCPGTIDTPITAAHAGKLGISKQQLVTATTNSTFLKRLGTTMDIAKATLFLASGDSDFITGTTLVVDGGYLAQ